jgi:hypothetical protein
MPPETIELDSDGSSPPTQTDVSAGSQVIIVLILPSPYENIQIHLPANEIAKPTTSDDPTTTTFVETWMKNIVIKALSKIDLVIEENDLSDNNQYLDDLKSLIKYPNTPKKTFEHFFQFSIYMPTSKHFVEQYTSQILQRFIDFYANPPSNRILILYLEFVGKARRHIKQLLSVPILTPSNATSASSVITTTSLQITDRVIPSRNNISTSPLTLSDNNENASNAESENTSNRRVENASNADSKDTTPKRQAEDPPAHTSIFLNNDGPIDDFIDKSNIRPTALLHKDSTGQPTLTPYTTKKKKALKTSVRQAKMKVDIPWDSNERIDNITTPEKFIAYVEENEEENYEVPYSNVTSWTRARFDPDDAEYVVDPRTKMFRSWQAERPEYGTITCYPVLLNDVYTSRDYFTSHFQTGAAARGYLSTDPKNLKNFQDAFPQFGPDDVNQYFHWHSELVDHCLIYGVFVPPAHTLRVDNYLGTWFSALPSTVQSDALKHFTKLLTGCLRKNMQSTVRQDHPSIADIIQNGSNNGYKILYLLARQAGKHPLLLRFPSEPHEPTQQSDTTVNQYRIAWTQYLQYRLFDGIVYSDRYFMQQFVRRLHPIVSQRIGTHILHEVDKVSIERALPKSFSPDELKQTLEDFVDYAKLPLDLLEKTPRQYQQQSSQAVRAIQSHTTTDDDIDLPAIVAALNNTSASNCYLCESKDHRMAQCQIYTRLRDNPRAITALLRQLRPKGRGNQRGPPRNIRQIMNEPSDHAIGEGNQSSNTAEAGEGNYVDDHCKNDSINDNATTAAALDTIESDFR